jgi:hypothetical protein
MGQGLSFLVSPETLGQQKIQADEQQKGLELQFGAQKEQEQLQAQEQMRSAQMQDADKRAEESNNRAMAMNAMTTKRQMDEISARQGEQNKLNDIETVQKNWAAIQQSHDQVHLAQMKTADQYGLDQPTMSAYDAAYQDASKKSQQMVADWTNTRRNLPPDKTMGDVGSTGTLNYDNLPIYQLQNSLDNPVVRKQYDDKAAQIQATTTEAQARTGEIIQKMGQMPKEASDALTAMRNYHMVYVGKNAEYNAMLSVGATGNAQALADKKAEVDAAKSAYDGASAQAQSYAADGHYGATVQNAAQGMKQAWGEGGAPAPGGMQTQPTDNSGTQTAPASGFNFNSPIPPMKF